MDGVSVEKAVEAAKTELKLIEELQKIRIFIRSHSVNSDDSDDESDSDDEPLLTKLKESWSNFKSIEIAKEIAEEQEEKLRQHQKKLKREYYSNPDAQRLMKGLLNRRTKASEQKKMADQLNRITHLKTREKNSSDQADVETFKTFKKRLDAKQLDAKKRQDAMRKILEQKRSGGKSHQKTARRNARRQKANALSKEEDPTDKELEEREDKELEERGNILRDFIKEVRRRDSDGNRSEMWTQLKL